VIQQKNRKENYNLNSRVVPKLTSVIFTQNMEHMENISHTTCETITYLSNCRTIEFNTINHWVDRYITCAKHYISVYLQDNEISITIIIE